MLCNGLLKVILKSSLERQNLHYDFYLTMSSEASNYKGLYVTIGVFLELRLVLQWKLEMRVRSDC